MPELDIKQLSKKLVLKNPVDDTRVIVMLDNQCVWDIYGEDINGNGETTAFEYLIPSFYHGNIEVIVHDMKNTNAGVMDITDLASWPNTMQHTIIDSDEMEQTHVVLMKRRKADETYEEALKLAWEENDDRCPPPPVIQPPILSNKTFKKRNTQKS